MSWSNAAITAVAEAVGNLADTGNGTPVLEFGNADFSVIYLSQPLDGTNAFSAAAAGIESGNIPAAAITGLADGTATHVQLKNKDGTVIDAASGAADAISGLIATGAGSPTLELGNSDFSVIYAILTLTNFAAASGGIAGANNLPILFTGTADGTPTHQRWKDGNGLIVGDEPVVGTANIIVGTEYSANAISITANALFQALSVSVAVVTGNDYSTSSATLTQPAS